MGVSTKQASVDHETLDFWSPTLMESSSAAAAAAETGDHDDQLPKPPQQPTTRRQQQQQQMEVLNCPRCGSTNTKFCYYNNYNKSQPRHFCKGCKRHWTKGGTLRNVPVGGGRKNKRLKPSPGLTTPATGLGLTPSQSQNVPLQRQDWSKGEFAHKLVVTRDHSQQNGHMFPIGHDEDIISDSILFKAMINGSSKNSLGHDDPMINAYKGTSTSNSSDQNLQLCFSSLNPLESIQSGVPSFFNQSLINGYDLGMESSTITTVSNPAAGASSIFGEGWQVPSKLSSGSSSVVAEMGNYSWNWNEIDTLVSADDLNIPWPDE